MTRNDPKPQSKGIHAIETGFRVLLAIQQGPPPVALKDIAERARMSPGQAHNYLSSFVRTDMVELVGRGQYQLGPSLAALGLSAMHGREKFEQVQKEVLRLHQHVRVGVAVSMWNADLGPIFLFNRPGIPEVWGYFDLRTGPASTIYTAAGCVFQALVAPTDGSTVGLRELLDRGEDEQEALRIIAKATEFVHTHGFAFSRPIEMPAYAAIAAPVWDDVHVCYAISVVGPQERIDPDPNGQMVARLLESTRALSRKFGAHPDKWIRPT